MQHENELDCKHFDISCRQTINKLMFITNLMKHSERSASLELHCCDS